MFVLYANAYDLVLTIGDVFDFTLKINVSLSIESCCDH